jgi:hypothetical protein
MGMDFSQTLRIGMVLLLLSGLAWLPPRSLAQLPAFPMEDCGGMSEDFRAILSPQSAILNPLAEMPASRVPRLRLFRITPGFLADPLGMQDDDAGLLGMQNLPSSRGAYATQLAETGPTVQESGPEWIQIGMGADVPFFDLRRPGDPGGFGYYRVNTQVALFDSPTTACALGLQAVTPAGAQFGGLQDGPTVVIPAFSVFHAFNDCLALQGFVSKNMPIYDAAAAPLQRHVQYGLALQRPLLADGPEGLRSLYFSMGALGQLNTQRDALRLVPNCDVLPGFQWHVNDNWWLSSAVLMPVGPVRTAPGQWQLTCSLQF